MQKIATEKCYVCGCMVEFLAEDTTVLLREAKCSCCGASLRNSDVAKVIVNSVLCKDISLQEAREDLLAVAILNTTADGAIHRVLAGLPGYVCGEYLDGVISGHFNNGIMCVDLRNLPFVDNKFDVIISEDVLEHVESLDQVLSEINRVLTFRGRHIFTVPVHEGKPTRSRQGLAKVYHCDPLRLDGAPVLTDFGDDVAQLVDVFGMETHRVVAHRFHSNDEITDVDANYAQYEECQDDLLRFFQYNSIVFNSAKCKQYTIGTGSVGIDATGERFLPNQSDPFCTGEHLQRYGSIIELITDKVILDAACGEGYGSYMMAEKAAHVTGIDISKDAIYNAKSKYRRDNLSFCEASITKIPLQDHSVDIVISFETIEHVSEEVQQDFMKEIKRVLKTDGILIISSPDKLQYSDIPDFCNEFHVREFYEAEFTSFLKDYFRYVDSYYQGFQTYGIINSGRTDVSPVPVESLPLSPHKYLIAICSDFDTGGTKLLSIFPLQKEYISGLYIDYGDGFTEINKFNATLNLTGRTFSVDFNIPLGTKAESVRWDPLEGSFCRCRIVSIDAGSALMKVEATNAWRVKNGYEEFMTIDPSYQLTGELEKVSHLHIEGVIDFFDESTLGQVFMRYVENNRIVLDGERKQITQLMREQEDLVMKIEQKNAQISQLSQETERLTMELKSVYSSRSWRFIKKTKKLLRRV